MDLQQLLNYFISYKFTINDNYTMTKQLVFKYMESQNSNLPTNIIELCLEFVGYEDFKFLYVSTGSDQVSDALYNKCFEGSNNITIQYDPIYPRNNVLKMNQGDILCYIRTMIILNIIAFGVILWLFITFCINYMNGFDVNKSLITIGIIMCFIITMTPLFAVICDHAMKKKSKLTVRQLKVESVYFEGVSGV